MENHIEDMKNTIEGPSKAKGKEGRNKGIRQQFAGGESAKYLAEKHKLSVGAIYVICKGIKKKPTPPHSSKQKPSIDVPVPPVKNEHRLHQFEPRYTERRGFSGPVQLYVGDICVQCGKTVQLLKVDW